MENPTLWAVKLMKERERAEERKREGERKVGERENTLLHQKSKKDITTACMDII